MLCVNAEKCMVIRLRQGFTLTVTSTLDNRSCVQYYSERAHLLSWGGHRENIFL